MPDTLIGCPSCKAPLRLKTLGKKVRCPKCNAVFAPPDQTAPLSDAEPEVRAETASDQQSASQATHDHGVADHADAERYRTVDSTERIAGSPLRPPQLADELGRLGPYRVLKLLGQGGMGMVYQAEDLRLKRHIALKVMRPEHAASEKARQRFLREAQTQASIEHDHIVTIHQADEDAGVPFIAMPLLKGETLSDTLKREARLPLADVLRIGRETAEGLAAAHERGLIHRDIKPSNIWLEARRSGVRSQESGVRSQESGVRGQESGSPPLIPDS
jgi:LSD1 subclass zinc finger protein